MENRPAPSGILRLAFQGREGAQDPFIARIFWQILEIRTHVYRGADRDSFDNKHSPVFQNLLEAKVAKEKCIELMRSHRERVKNRETADFENGVIRINEAVDMELNMSFKDFFIRGNIALKALVKLAGFLGYNMSFAFTDDKKFEEKKTKFLKNHPEESFVEYVKVIEEDRQAWYRQFIEIRNMIEHEGFEVPKINYLLGKNDEIKTFYATINHQPLDEILERCWENLFHLTEEMLVFLLEKKINPPFALFQVPEDQRPPEKPFKYIISI
jgi:hypothetical protein